MSKTLAPGWVSLSWGQVAIARRFALKDSRGTCCSGSPVEGSRASLAPKKRTKSLISLVPEMVADEDEDDDEEGVGRILGRIESALSVL